jgi:hypothetical protein
VPNAYFTEENLVHLHKKLNRRPDEFVTPVVNSREPTISEALTMIKGPAPDDFDDPYTVLVY